MGLVNIAVAIYIMAFIAVMAALCVIGYFKNFYGKETPDSSEIVGQDNP